MENIHVCRGCGVEFEAKHGNARYCSSECRTDGRRQSFRDYQFRHTEVATCERCGADRLFLVHPSGRTTETPFCLVCTSRATLEKRRADQEKTLCPQCGAEFTRPRQVGRPRIYCSARCQVEAKKQYQNKCEHCGEPFRSTNASSRWCSQRCRNFARRGQFKYGTRPCFVCGKEFQIRDPRVECCSLRCSTEKGKALKSNPPEERTCLGCGAKFTTKSGTNAGLYRYCSARCKFKAWKIAEPEHAMVSHRNRYERLFIAEREPYDRTEIFNRDGWRCQLCGKKVNPELRHPHKMSASIDHIVPIALGGNDTPANVQLAHLGCNVRKGMRGGQEQLRLVG